MLACGWRRARRALVRASPRLRCYKLSYLFNFNSQSRFSDLSAESAWGRMEEGCKDPTESSAERQRRSPRGWQHRDWESNPGPTNGKRRSQVCATEPHIYCQTLSGRLPGSCRPTGSRSVSSQATLKKLHIHGNN